MVCPPLPWCPVRGVCSLSHFRSLLLRSGSGVFLVFLFVFLSMICPLCTHTQLFLVPHCFFVSCCWRRCGCRPCSKGPRPQPISLRVKTQSLP